MCFGAPSMPAQTPPPLPPPPAPSPQLPDAPVQAAGKAARERAAAASGSMQTILNQGGAAGLTKPASTTAKVTLG